MRILIVGSGGREHALAWKIKQSARVKEIYVAPGNAGTAKIAQNVSATSSAEIIEWLKTNKVDLVVVGPDSHLAEGLVDRIEELGIRAFGPTKKASQIEWSKAYAKKLMKEEGIPTAKYEVFTELEQAELYIKTQQFPLVIKASGLALGKGVIIAEDWSQAESALKEIMSAKVFGTAGEEVVIEEYLTGKEISVHAFCDGESVVLFPPAQDHKRAFDNDQGPNTGGMGTIAPVPGVTKEQMKEIEAKIVLPTLKALQKRGRPFKGVLFPGIMLTNTGPKVIEFNARFGDPETQSYMRILETDLVEILVACVEGDLKNIEVTWSENYACCIVCVAPGYPAQYETGAIISGLTVGDKESIIFQAGTKLIKDEIVTSGGRVLGVTALATSLRESLKKAYFEVEKISFPGMRYRKDIGQRSLDKTDW